MAEEIIRIKNYLPFIGFKFNECHSTELGIKRVSNGDRYDFSFRGQEQVYSSNTLKRGINFLNSDLTQKEYVLNIAFDNLSETNFRRMRQVFDIEQEGYLILDERPYKKVKVVCNGTNQIQWVCFMQNGERVYKGEGVLSFINYTGYWEMVSSCVFDYYQITDEKKAEIEESYMSPFKKYEYIFEDYFNYFSTVNLYSEQIYFKNAKYNTSYPVDNATKKYYGTIPSFNQSYPVFYLHFDPSYKEKVSGINIYFGLGVNPSHHGIEITNLQGVIKDDYIKIDGMNDKIYGMVMGEDGELKFSGRDYSSYISRPASFFKRWPGMRQRDFYNYGALFNYQAYVDYNLYWVTVGASPEDGSQWDIFKVDYLNKIDR